MPIIVYACFLFLALLVTAWAVCVRRLPRAERYGLFPTGIAVFVLAGILFGGDWLLAAAGLTFRIVPRVLLALLLWMVGLLAGVLTVQGVGQLFGGWRMAAAALCLVIAMVTGTFFGGVWVLSYPRERVGTYRETTVVEGLEGLFDPYYALYDYRGSLVRGKERLEVSYGRFLEEVE